MITQLNLLARCLVAALLLLFLFNGAQAQVVAGTAQTRSNAARPIDPPPEEEPPPYNYSAFSSQSVPTTMTAGTAYTVTVSMYNNGTTTWSSNALHALGSYNPMDNSTWGGGRVGMAGDVAPGQTATFTFQVTAPSTPGNYNFQWRMVQDGVEWFGGTSTNVVVNVVAAPRNDSQFLSQSVPASMIAGAQYPVSLTFANTGNTTWDPTNGKYVLLAVNPVNNETWVYSRIPLSGPVAPGQQTTVAWTTRAPATPGTYNFQWIILQEGVELIGTPSTNIGVVVSAPAPVNDAQFVSQNVPATMVPGQTYPVTVIMQNTGTTTWPAGDAYRLGPSGPLDNTTWGRGFVAVNAATAPGQTAAFTFSVTAPSSPGTYNFEWKMLQSQVEWFGTPSQNLAIEVDTQPTTVTYIHTDALGSPVARSDSTGTVISRTQYEPYGRTVTGVMPTIGFTGHVNDADTGLVYMQQRYYDPVAGRFLSIDPVVTDANTGGSFNRYAYAINNPYKYVDPDGRNPLLKKLVDVLVKVLVKTEQQAAKNAAKEVTKESAKATAKEATKVEAKEAAKETGKEFSKEKQSLVEMAKGDKKTGITPDDMKAYKDLNKELPDPFPSNKVRGPEAHSSGAPSSQSPHGHVGPVNHIPVIEP